MSKSIKQLCRNLLPENYHQIIGEVGRIQAFIEEVLPDDIKSNVDVINANDNQVVIAADSAQIANYLNLYRQELEQQIRETFGSQQNLIIKTLPGEVRRPATRPEVPKPNKLSSETADQVDKGADWIEHDGLRESLKALAKTLRR
ncbi:MAG: hypothetical protein ACI845_003047 [Gammaproteobacteria bacterium]|jgi:hypothetical protein